MQLEQRPSSVASKPEHLIYPKVSWERRIRRREIYLASPAITTGDGSSLARRGWLVMLIHVGGRWWLGAVWIGGRGCLVPFVRAWQTVERLLLLLVVVMLGHVGARVPWWLSGRRREGCGELGTEGRVSIRGGREWLGNQADGGDLHEEAVGRRRGQAVARSAAASG